MHDLIIIGGGPAGAGAGIYAARKQLKTVLLTYAVDKQLNFGGQSVVSEDIQNWIGTISISGQDLAKQVEAHLRAYAGEYVEIRTDTKVASIAGEKGNFTVTTESGETFQGKTVLITTGSTRRKLPTPGADKFEHKGLTYCASCDGPLFAGQDVAVVGGGNAGFESALQLLAYAKSVTLVDRGEQFRADPITINKAMANPKMKALTDIDLVEVVGNTFVSGLKYKNLKSGEEGELPVTGIFVEIGLVPATDFAAGILDLNEHKQIKIDPWTQRTSKDGIWAAGDCTDVRYHQNNIAVGDGVRALEDIFNAL